MENINYKYVKKVNLGLSTFWFFLIFTVLTTLLTMSALLIQIYPINYYLNSLSTIAFITSGLSLCITLVLISDEFWKRKKKDSIYNFIHSIHMTFRFRGFLERERNKEKEEDITIASYNSAIKKLVIDVTNKNICFYLKLPVNVQSQILIKEIQIEIKEQMANDFPRHTFSDFIKREGYLILIGTL